MYKRRFAGGHNGNHNGGQNHRQNRFRKEQRSDYDVVAAIRSMQNAPKADVLVAENYSPKHEFSDFAICDQLKKNIDHKKYTSPTPIQDEGIPEILNGRDLIGVANTGTGKTAAFLIPLIEKVLKDKSQKVLIVTPTRELAMQISQELFEFTYALSIQKAVCVGGMNIRRQIDDLRRNPQFVIGTPGRLKDLSERGNLRLNEYNNVVLDEADRMVDMGFIGDIKYFIGKLPKIRQSLFFSATIPPKVAQILHSFVTDPVTISVKTSDLLDNITQELINVTDKFSKLDTLHNLLSGEVSGKILIFGRTKWGVQKLSDELVKRGFNAAAIHGNKNQGQRQRVMDDFRRNRISILLATDVVARGIDVSDITHVINYDIPGSYEDYIHRIGRTGRAGKKGRALTFIQAS